MKCSGLDLHTREAVEISFAGLIEAVDPYFGPAIEHPYVAPGFIDLQVNGFAGVDYCSPSSTAEQISESIRAMFATGVCRLYPTVITGSPENMHAAVENLARAKHQHPDSECAAIAGIHVEGPYISPEDGPRGAHPQHWVRPPDLNEFRRLRDAAEGLLRLTTVSPEWPQMPRFIEAVTGEGVVVSIGHTKASAQQIKDAVSAGATMSTHLGNGADAMLPRHPNYIWEQLADDRLAASFIADGIHLGDSFMKAAFRAKGGEHSILITDAVMPAGCAPGSYRLGEVEVELHQDGSVRLRGGTRLAGSALRMDEAIGNVNRLVGIPLASAITMATRNPARVARIASRLRGLTPGDLGDLVRFRFDDVSGKLNVLETYMGGKLVFRSS